MPKLIDGAREELKDRIRGEGLVMSESILSVDSFLNHQVDSEMIGKIGEAIAERFEDEGVTRVVTAAASGIAIAYATSRELNRRSSHDVYPIYAKKAFQKP